MRQQLVYDGVDSVPKHRLSCSCGNDKFRHTDAADEDAFWLNLPTNRTITEYRPGGDCPKLDGQVLCTSCHAEYDRKSSWHRRW